MFLLIENKGQAPVEAFTVLGDSGSRHRPGMIGQFGSGTKHAINLLLRKGVEFYIFSGKTRLEFFVERKYVTEADGTKRESYPVKCRLSGDQNRTINCGWTVDFGALDWKETRMALREFVSNAIDCSKIMDSEPVVRPEPTRRARAGYTRVFVNLHNDDVKDFYENLGHHFLHFSHTPSQVNDTFLDKMPGGTGPKIYYEGCLITELPAKVRSAFDYNFKKGEINIDECRNSNEYVLRARIAQLINKADEETLAGLIELASESDVYESDLDDYYLSSVDDNVTKANWMGAWQRIHGDAVLVDKDATEVAEVVRKKGHKTASLRSDSFSKVARKMGVRVASDVLGEQGAKGNIEVRVTPEAEEALNEAWGLVESLGMTGGKGRPALKCFKQLMDAETETLGYYRDSTVFIREDLGGKLAFKTALEEVAHYVTGATDNSRDFQNYFIDMVAEIAMVPCS